MKSKYGILLKLQLMRALNPAILLKNRNPAKRNRALTMTLAIVVLGGVMMVYSGLLARGFIAIGAAEAIPRLMTGIGAAAIVFLAFLQSNGAMFGSRDFDLMLSLPVNAVTVTAVKFTFLYLFGEAVCLIAALPAFIIYGMNVPCTALEILGMVLAVLFTPVLPVVIALVFGTVIVTLTSRLPFRQFFALALSVLLLVGVLVWTGRMQNTTVEELGAIGQMMAGMMDRIYPLAGWSVSLAEGRGALGFLGFAALSLAAMAIFLLVVGKNYVRINSVLASLRRTRVKKARMGKRTTPFRALYRKELKLLSSCTIYALNALIGLILMVVASVAVLFVSEETFAQALGMPGMESMLLSLAPMLLGLLVGMNSTSMASLSLEGRSRWIMCSLPVKPMTVFHAKMWVYLSLALPCIVVSALCVGIRLKAAPVQWVLLFVIPMAYGVFASVFGMAANVKFPSYDWTHEQQAVKNSMSALTSVFGGLLIGGAPLALALFRPQYALWISLGGAALALIGAGVCYLYLRRQALYE